VINPKQKDCAYPTVELCGAGVAFKVVQALGGITEAAKYLDLAAVATIADLVPLLGENRAIVYFGLKTESLNSLGLNELLKIHEITAPTAVDIAYKISPRINAAGRIGDAYRAFELLTTSDKQRIKALIDELEQDNLKRKELSEEIYNEAIGDLSHENLIDNFAIVLSNPAWQKGITGIIAARLVDDYLRPVFIITGNDDIMRGTCRGFDDISVYNLLYGCKDLLAEFGGHSAAAGFSVRKENIAEFKNRIYSLVNKEAKQKLLPIIKYDLSLDCDDISLEFAKDLEVLEPLGNSNAVPIFKLTVNDVIVAPSKNNFKHTGITLPNGKNIIAFNGYNQNQFLSGSGKKQLAVEIKVNTFLKNREEKIVLKGISNDNLYINDSFAKANFIKNVSIKKTNEPKTECYNKNDLPSLLNGKIYGTLVVAGQKRTYDDFISKYSDKVFFKEFIFSSINNNYSKIIVSPNFDKSLDIAKYEKIIFLDSPIGGGLAGYINSRTSAKIFVPDVNNEKEILSAVSLERTSLIRYYELFKLNSYKTAISIFKFFSELKKNNPDIDIVNTVVSLLIFKELRLLDIDNTNGFKISILNNTKVELDKSNIFNYISTILCLQD